MIQVESGVGPYTVILPLGAGNPLVSISTAVNGDITLTSTLGMEFAGRIIIT